jgi:hypothetical protein
VDDPLYFHRRANQSLDQAARSCEPARGIYLELARRYAMSWQRSAEPGPVMVVSDRD